MIIYGTDQCKDCVQCRHDLDNAGISYEYRNISEKLIYLKEFLELRDKLPLFEDAKTEGYIGIPTLVYDDGSVTLQWQTLL